MSLSIRRYAKTPAVLQGTEADQWVLNELKEKLDAGDLLNGKRANYRKDGSKLIMEWKTVTARNAKGEITHYLAIQRELHSNTEDI